MFLANNLKYLRKNAGFTQDYIADKLGYKSFTTIQKWESGVSEPSISVVHILCDIYGVEINDILYKDLSNPTFDLPDNIIELNKINKIPVVGSIAAGKPKLATEDIESYVMLDSSYTADFALRVNGDSMIDAGINDGDLALIKRDLCIENGEICAVSIDGHATLKRLYRNDDFLTLQPCNSKYQPIIVKENDEPYIVGKLTGIVRKY